jgi:hypothetical protein
MSPELLFWSGLAFKVVLTAGIVVTASVVVERSGPFVGAIIASLPTAAGAAYIILALEHPPPFIAQSAVGSIAANAAVGVFACAYALIARSRGFVPTLVISLAVWLAFAAILQRLDLGLIAAVLLNVAVYTATFIATRPLRAPVGESASLAPTRGDLAMRALTVGAFVAAVTTASHHIGSFASGMFAVFPVAMASFMAILHPRLGGLAAGRVLAHAQAPLFGLVLGFAAVHGLAERTGVWWAFAAGLAACIVWNFALWALRRAAGGAAPHG